MIFQQSLNKLTECMCEQIVVIFLGKLWKNSWWVAQVLLRVNFEQIMKEPLGFFQNVPAEQIEEQIMKELSGFFQNLTTE